MSAGAFANEGRSLVARAPKRDTPVLEELEDELLLAPNKLTPAPDELPPNMPPLEAVLEAEPKRLRPLLLWGLAANALLPPNTALSDGDSGALPNKLLPPLEAALKAEPKMLLPLGAAPNRPLLL